MQHNRSPHIPRLHKKVASTIHLSLRTDTMHANAKIAIYTIVCAFLLYMANDLVVRRYRPYVWNGRGDCPIDDPFGAGMYVLNQALIHARRTDDSGTVQRIYAFIMQHVHEHYHIDHGFLEVNEQRIALRDPKGAFDRRWDETIRVTGKGDLWVPIQFWLAHDECKIQFDSADGDFSWRFSFVAKYPP